MLQPALPCYSALLHCDAFVPRLTTGSTHPNLLLSAVQGWSWCSTQEVQHLECWRQQSTLPCRYDLTLPLTDEAEECSKLSVYCAGTGSDGGPQRSTESGRRSEHSDAGLQQQQAEQQHSQSPPLERTQSTESVLLAPQGKVTHLEPRYPFSQCVPQTCPTTATLLNTKKHSPVSGLCHVACPDQTGNSQSLEWCGPETDVAPCLRTGWQS